MANYDVKRHGGRMGNPLREEYTIDTPENVTFGYEVAGIGSRLIGALVDTTIVLAVQALFLILILVIGTFVEEASSALWAIVDGSDSSWISGLLIALYALLSFILFWGYFILFEYIWNGQTPGKRVAGTRVVQMDGSSISFLANIIRNLVRSIDLLPTAYALGAIVMFCNRHARRIGDFAAGTIVIRDQQAVSLDSLDADLGREQPASGQLSPQMHGPYVSQEKLLEQYPQLTALTDSDYELITDALQRESVGRLDPLHLSRLARIVAAKVGHPEAASDQIRFFLREVADAFRQYYRL
jgi:uncharacterized RDD family membrane protein YckC